jgi:hypothetical protein
MKTKLILWLGLTVLIGTGVWFWRQHRTGSRELSRSGVAHGEIGQSQNNLGKPVAPTQPTAALLPLVGDGTNLNALSVPVRSIVDAKEQYLKRQSSVAVVTTNLAAVDRQALYAFLLQPDPSDHEQTGQVLKNHLLDRLCELDPLTPGLAEVLIQMYHNKNQDLVLRDYAVQHLAAYYEQLEITRQNDPQIQQAVQDVLWEALGETDSSIAGTALLALTRLSKGRPEFEQNRIRAAALQLAGEGQAGELTRSTALQVAARLGTKAALPILMQVAADGGTLPLRISAIGALGTLGAPEAVSLLNTFLAGPEARFKLPARQALRQIELKTTQTPTAGNEK